VKGGAVKRRKLLRLWEADRRCRWCQRETVLVFRPPGVGHRQFPPRDDESTLDHLHSRYSAKRGRVANGEQMIVLACWRCNNDRGRDEERAVPLEELRRRAGNGGEGR
jgi:5-methylcytosine-specific restriction endonuclease McrA